jgi:membrane-associated phospholipid phosphatase
MAVRYHVTRVLVLLSCHLMAGRAIAAQQAPAHSHEVRWWHLALVAGTIGVASLADRTADRWFQEQRSSGSDAVARMVRHGGQPELTLGVPAGLLVAGAIRRSATLERRGGRVIASVIVAGLTAEMVKKVAGRVRPVDTTDQYVFRPFSDHDALPSGHATMAFALATSLSEEIHRPWASALLYVGAAGTAWSRLNDHRHWLSDVLTGGVIGVAAGNMIEGRWRIFGLGTPHILVEPQGTRLEWRAGF